jgi:hypothetical protein
VQVMKLHISFYKIFDMIVFSLIWCLIFQMIFQSMTPALNHRRFEPDEEQLRVSEYDVYVKNNLF